MAGKYFDELEVGSTFTHQPSRTVTETDNLLFTALTLNPQPLHLDAEFARSTQHGQILVNSIFTLGLVVGLSVGDTTLGTTLGNLGFDKTTFPNPVFIGDTITSHTKVVEQTRIGVETRPGCRDVRTSGHQSARRGGLLVLARRDDAAATHRWMNRVRRAVHFVPGANEKMLVKSLATDADSLVLDLEDAVTPDRKADARVIIAGWLKDVEFGRQERIVRMNPLDTPWGLEDLRVTMVYPPDAYVVPKVRTLADIQAIDAAIGRLEADYGHPPNEVGLILVSTETPQGVLNLPTFTQCGRVVALSWGAEDLAAAIGARRNRDERGEYLDVFKYCRTHTLLCATAGDVQPLDTVYVDIKNLDGLRQECQTERLDGIHRKDHHPSGPDTDRQRAVHAVVRRSCRGPRAACRVRHGTAKWSYGLQFPRPDGRRATLESSSKSLGTRAPDHGRWREMNA